MFRKSLKKKRRTTRRKIKGKKVEFSGEISETGVDEEGVREERKRKFVIM